MTPRRLLLTVAAAALALLIALLLRRKVPTVAAPDSPAAGVPVSSGSAPGSPAGEPADRPVSNPGASAENKSLYGLRRVADDPSTAAALAKRAEERAAWSEVYERVMKEWEKPIDLNETDAPLPDVCARILAKFGLQANIAGDMSGKTITFKVDQLSARQAFDLITKMADLRFMVTPDGKVWILGQDELAPGEPAWAKRGEREKDADRMHAIFRSATRPPEEPAAAKTLRTPVTVDILSQPFAEVRERLGEATGTPVGMSRAAWEVTDESDKLITIVGGGRPYVDVLRELADAVGLDLFISGDLLSLLTKEQAENAREDEKQAKADAEEEVRRSTAEQDALLAKMVAVKGQGLTTAQVAKQLEARLGRPVHLDPEAEAMAARWEGDGKEQTAREVLGILHAAGVTWMLFDSQLWLILPDARK